MTANRRTDTKPEIRLRSALHGLGLRFRKDHRLDVEGMHVRPDIVFTRARVAVFMDGCFWHSCPVHRQMPRANREYWEPKLARNIERDSQVTEALQRSGWTVIRIWEHEAADMAAASISEIVLSANFGPDKQV